jgi:hypothetical protein
VGATYFLDRMHFFAELVSKHDPTVI